MAIVSVIIPAYNSEKWIKKAITSVLDQTFTDFEVIVVNDGSTDKTEEMVHTLNDPRLIYERLSENSGVHAARNRGMELSSGDIFVFLDADDELMPQALTRCVETFSQLPEDSGIIHANGITDEGELTGFNVEYSRHIVWQELLCGTAVRRHKGCFAAVKRKSVNDLRWALQNFDFIFWRRIQRQWKTFVINEVLMRYHLHTNPNSLSVMRRNRKYKFDRALKSSRVYEQFINEMGTDLKRLCPSAYNIHLNNFGIMSLLAGRKNVARKAAIEMMQYKWNWKAIKIIILSFVPWIFIRKVYLRGL